MRPSLSLSCDMCCEHIVQTAQADDLCGNHPQMNGYHGNFPTKCAYYIPAGWTDWFGLQTIGFGACSGPGCQPVVIRTVLSEICLIWAA